MPVAGAGVRKAAGLGDLDELGGGVDLGGEVLAALLERQALVLLLARRAGVDHELVGRVGRAVLAARVGLLGDLDLDGRAVGALERLGLEGLDGLVGRGRERRHRLPVGAVRGAHAHDPAEAAAVLEEAVDGVRQVRALHERAVVGLVRIAEDLRELGPVRDPHRRVDRTAGGQAHERGDRRADALDRLRGGRHLLDVHAGSQVRGHAGATPPLGSLGHCATRCGAPPAPRRRTAAAWSTRDRGPPSRPRRGPRG